MYSREAILWEYPVQHPDRDVRRRNCWRDGQDHEQSRHQRPHLRPLYQARDLGGRGCCSENCQVRSLQNWPDLTMMDHLGSLGLVKVTGLLDWVTWDGLSELLTNLLCGLIHWRVLAVGGAREARICNLESSGSNFLLQYQDVSSLGNINSSPPDKYYSKYLFLLESL